MNDLHLVEGGESRVLDLEGSLVTRLVDMGAITAVPVGSSRWEVSAGHKVGVVMCDGLTVWVKPKLPISRLLWLLCWAKKDIFILPDLVGFQEEKEVVPAIAEAFCTLAERALREGLILGYRSVEASEQVLRGRLRTEDQLKRRFGIPIPLLVRYDDYMTDIPENQILKAAALRIISVAGLKTPVRNRLQHLRGLLVDVSTIPHGAPAPSWTLTRLNARYSDVLWLAEAILRLSSVEHIPGQLRLNGFLLNLAKVFEEFVTTTLKAELENIGGKCTQQDPFTLDVDGLINIQPDLVWRVRDDAVAVVDAKYKAEKPYGFPQADLYQAHAYATAYGLYKVHLVYADGNEVPANWRVRNSDVVITAHTLRLEEPPEAILDQIKQLATTIATDVSVP